MKNRKLLIGALAAFSAGIGVGIYLSQTGNKPPLTLVASAEAQEGKAPETGGVRTSQKDPTGTISDPGKG